MAFTEVFSNDIENVGAGERFGTANVELNSTVFEDGLIVGRFAKLDTGSIDLMDGSATPDIAGVVMRLVSRGVEGGDVIDHTIYDQIDYMRFGLCTVAVKAAETPALGGRVYVSNAGDANDGLATATNTDVPVNAEFIKEVKSGVWLILMTPPQGDVATHIGDATGAHAASAISIVDAGLYTTAIQVEAALQELYRKFPVLVADPGDGLAIPVTKTASVAMTSGALAETRTIAIPSIIGMTITMSFDVDGGGDIVVTAASAIDQAGDVTMTFADAGDVITLRAVQVAGALVWRVVENDGVALA